MTYRSIVNASRMSRGYGYITGGTNGTLLTSTEKYDDIANAWSNKGNLNTARYYPAGFSLNGYGYIAGGYSGSPTAVTEKYDDIVNTWTVKTSLNTARTYITGFSLNGYGYTAGGDTGSVSKVTEKYDDIADTWTAKADLNTARYSLAGFSLTGYGYTAGGSTSATEKYDDIANTWTAKTNLNTARSYMPGFSLNGYGYTPGGYSGSPTAVTEKYDDIVNTWTVKTSLNTARYSPAGFSLNGYGYAATGYIAAETDVTEKYDDIADNWTAKTSLSTARYFSSGFAIGSLQADIKNPELIPINRMLNRKVFKDSNERVIKSQLPTKIVNSYWHASWDEHTTVQGTWAILAAAGQTDYDPSLTSVAGTIINYTSANNDEVHFGSLTLTAGTYKVFFAYYTDGNRGIIEILHGTTSLGTTDSYTASGENNHTASYTYSPTTRVSGNLRLKCTGKNGSSNDYYILISRLEIIRTG